MDPLPTKTLGQRVRELRQKAGFGAVRIREKLKDPETELTFWAAFLSDIENGRRFPSDDLIDRDPPRSWARTPKSCGKLDPRGPSREIQDLGRLTNARAAFAFRRAADFVQDHIFHPRNSSAVSNQPPLFSQIPLTPNQCLPAQSRLFLEYFLHPEAYRVRRRRAPDLACPRCLRTSPGPVAVEISATGAGVLQSIMFGTAEKAPGQSGVLGKWFGMYQCEPGTDHSSRIGIIRTRSTIAHENRHGELHEEKFIAKLIHDHAQGDLFSKPTASSASARGNDVCRENQIFGYNKDEWWGIF